ncbi:MAG: S-methyl-5-thioribose kinase [Actinomycetota bacterium]|nr:S-methyl-5-thioribose kinase [Actinomycetota bacterium]
MRSTSGGSRLRGELVSEDDGALARALAAPFLRPGPLTASEIGDGNLNVVYRVSSGQESVVVKHAPPYLRVVGDAWPLTQDRLRIESEALQLHGELAPGRVPVLLAVDLEHAAMVIEDLSSHEVWRTELVRGRHVEGIAEQVGRYCARTLLGTSDLLMDPSRRKALATRFTNPELCSITEELVFTAPYVLAESNRWDDAANELATGLRADLPMRRAAAQLLWEFRTRHEALVHGDLHTGSIMVADGDARMIDPEFAFFGPMAYDTGNVLANLGFSAIAHEEMGNASFAGTVTGYAHEFWDALSDEVRHVWPAGQPWVEPFLAELLADSARYAATELVRRMVGLAHVVDVDSLPPSPRLHAQERAVAGARSLALGPPVRTLTDLWTRITTEETPT